ncbi:ROK family protein [Caldanaerobacter subterraneus]|uniref:Transcriptional regulator n=1 Tax=Caldanaerobacter subterraneus subsp. pacificus DSM 12653 TaxID=391606 RepID=A0A0F5PJC6_9THEO|nr:ROK family protein [Caldanaerobacter subterraneus]KKC28758.1 transcriptional regulator [Caldanaerobacter subterraneus subsp. pacificus DSM 12653]
MKVIGIDIGGTKILGGIISTNGNLIKFKETPTQAKLGREVILKNLFNTIDELIDEDTKGIGIGSAGRINFDTGVVEYATDNLPGWTGCKLKEILEKKYKIPVVVDNDVNAAAIGEMWLGSGKGYKSMLVMTIGTGVGGAIIYNGELIRGSSWSAGEIGHMILYPEGRQCNCGQRGCLEQYASGTAIYKEYNELLGEEKVSSAKEVFELYKENDDIAMKVINSFIKSLTLSILSLKNIIDPEVFIIGGGVIGSKDLWWDKLKIILGMDVNVVPANLGVRATMFGAAKLILDAIY